MRKEKLKEGERKRGLRVKGRKVGMKEMGDG